MNNKNTNLLVNKLFVYGTLKKNFPNFSYLKDAKYLYDAYTIDKFNMIDFGHYPGLVKNSKGYPVKGEVYEIDKNILEEIDILEGYPSFYNRELSPTTNNLVYLYFLEDNDFENKNINYIKPSEGKKYLEWENK